MLNKLKKMKVLSIMLTAFMLAGCSALPISLTKEGTKTETETETKTETASEVKNDYTVPEGYTEVLNKHGVVISVGDWQDVEEDDSCISMPMEINNSTGNDLNIEVMECYIGEYEAYVMSNNEDIVAKSGETQNAEIRVIFSERTQEREGINPEKENTEVTFLIYSDDDMSVYWEAPLLSASGITQDSNYQTIYDKDGVVIHAGEWSKNSVYPKMYMKIENNTDVDLSIDVDECKIDGSEVDAGLTPMTFKKGDEWYTTIYCFEDDFQEDTSIEVSFKINDMDTWDTSYTTEMIKLPN